MAGSTQILDAPDGYMRAIRQKIESRVQLTDEERRRLANREAIENEILRVGGRVNDPMTSVPESAGQYGQRLRQRDDAIRAGYFGADSTPSGAAPVPAPGTTRNAPPPMLARRSPAAPLNRPPAGPMALGGFSEALPPGRQAPPVQTGGAPSAAPAETSLAVRRIDPANVNSYTGSAWARPGSPMAPKPIQPRNFGGDARTNYGRLSVPRTDIDADGNPISPPAGSTIAKLSAVKRLDFGDPSSQVGAITGVQPRRTLGESANAALASASPVRQVSFRPAEPTGNDGNAIDQSGNFDAENNASSYAEFKALQAVRQNRGRGSAYA